MESLLSYNVRANDIDYKLLKFINSNDVPAIINLFQHDAHKINFSLYDRENNTFLMLAIKKIKPVSSYTFHMICPIVQRKIWSIDDVFYLFLNSKCYVNCQNIDGDTALMLLIKKLKDSEYQNNEINLIQALIAHNININMQDNRGYTALMMAINLINRKNEKQVYFIIKLLLENNADIYILSNDGKEALTLALTNEAISFELVQLLVSHHRMVQLLLNESRQVNEYNSTENGHLLHKLGEFYQKHKRVNEMQKCFYQAIKFKNDGAKLSLYYHYVKIKPEQISKEEYNFIATVYKKETVFALLYKTKYLHQKGYCEICFETVENLVKLPCHEKHLMCVTCVKLLKNALCPFCRKSFYRIDN